MTSEGSAESFLHHIGAFAADREAGRVFFTAVLAPLGVRIGREADVVTECRHPDRGTPSLSLERAGGRPTGGARIAFAAPDRAAAEAFHSAAVAAGGTSRHGTRQWPEHRAHCAFVSDPDGDDIEAVHKEVAS